MQLKIEKEHYGKLIFDWSGSNLLVFRVPDRFADSHLQESNRPDYCFG